MGSTAPCTITVGKQRSRGSASLESSELIFRAADGALRLKIALSAIASVKAADGLLHVQRPQGLAVFELGSVAEKWRDKILHPKSRFDKLGVKPGSVVSLLGNFEPEFVKDIESCTKHVSKEKAAADADWIFFAADSLKRLAQLRKVAKSLTGSTALWIVYPKGRKDITENDVLGAGRNCGLRDVKVVGFSPTHTALKFVVPISRR